MLVQVIGFAGDSVKERIPAVLSTGAKALWGRVVVARARALVMDAG